MNQENPSPGSLAESILKFLSDNDALNKKSQKAFIKNIGKDLVPSGLKQPIRSTIVLGFEPGTSLRDIKDGIVKDTESRNKNKCYSKSNKIYGFYGEMEVWLYFFTKEKELVLLFLCGNKNFESFRGMLRKSSLRKGMISKNPPKEENERDYNEKYLGIGAS
jgi:hypothetical protein